jgi:4-hydroxy-3-methylbut-2-enyl diphosphate reductase IspH
VVEPWQVNLVQNVAQVDEAFYQLGRHEIVLPESVGVTAGTSTPIEMVEKVVARLQESYHE